jgi:cytochrome c oxidase subunit 1
MNTTVVSDPTGFELPQSQRRFLRWTIYIGYFALVAGVAHGLAQALSYANINILENFPRLRSYYQGLSVHGVMNALVLTFAFSNAFLPLMTARSLGRQLIGWLTQTTFWTLLIGVILTGYALVTDQASVLYTSYSPLQAHWTYYLGLALVVVSTYLASANMYVILARWRRDNRGERIPLLAFISVLTYAMWNLASLGIVVLFLGFLLPWSVGLIEKIDPLLNRTLFWFTGHAIVYAWLLPAYVSWYAIVPRQAGGKLVSDPLARLVFVMFLLLSIPTGFHHQYTDPGIPEGMKALHGVLTFGVFYPSLATAFTVVAALEMGGRKAGGRGLLGWLRKLPWGDPSLVAQILAMFGFVFGGITGLINASFTVNQVVHNTAWIPGHFHLTVGTAVALTLMGVAYWIIPYLTDRKLWGRRIALAQAWLWIIGVMIMARGLISGGLEGMPRRIFRVAANYTNESWELAGILSGIGGTIMTVSGILFFIVIVMTVFFGKKGEGPKDIPITETLLPPTRSGWDVKLDKIGFWMVMAIVLVVIAYGPFFVLYLPPNMVSPGFLFY